MFNSFCQQIEEERLVELYVEGKLQGELLNKFEQHLTECIEHAKAVTLEKALTRGIKEFGRQELKSKIKKSIKKREDVRLMILRYAAIFFIVVITPLILYYQFRVVDTSVEKSGIESHPKVVTEDNFEEPEIEMEDKNREAGKGVIGVEKGDTSPVAPPAAPAKIKEETKSTKLISSTVEQAPPQPTKGDETILSEQMKDTQGISISDKKEVSSRMLTTSALKMAAGAGRERLKNPDSIFYTSGNALTQSLRDSINNKIIELNQKTQDCYKTLLDVKSETFVEFVIKTNGKIKNLKIESDQEKVALDECLHAEISTWEFPSVKEEVLVQKVFQYEPQ